jgi:hypothetical protein
VKPRLLLTVIAAAALVIAGAAVIVLTINQPPRSPRPGYSGAYSTADPDEPSCPSPVTMAFKTDEAMLQAAPRLEQDSRFYSMIRETKAQNYEQFKRTYAGQPELIALARPESLPATVSFSMDPSSSRRSMIADLKSSYASADVQDPCAVTATTTTRPTR